MDWYSWLSKTGLEPDTVYAYGLAFNENELEEEDIFCFNHEFLQSIGISIAKHRLQILKSARKHKGNKSPRARRFMVAIKKYLKTLNNNILRKESALDAVEPSSDPSGLRTRWNIARMKRNKKLMVTWTNQAENKSYSTSSCSTSPSWFFKSCALPFPKD